MPFTHTYETYTDLSTEPDKLTIITVYAGGNTAVFRSLAFFCAYKYYKLGPVTIKLVPASTLPVDPSGLSYEAGEKQVDPRDLLTPGLVRITNGEDFFMGVNYNKDNAGGVFNAMLLDDRWFKWSLQSGITKTAVPLYWNIGQIRQDFYPGAVTNVPVTYWTNDNEDELKDPFNYATTGAVEHYIKAVKSSDPKKWGETKAVDTWTKIGLTGYSSGRGLFQTGTHGTLGWLPTDANIYVGFNPDDKGQKPKLTPNVNNVPQVELFRIVLPPARKTQFFYRMFIHETVYFKEKVVQNPEHYIKNSQGERVTLFYRPLDRFIFAPGIKGADPNKTVPPESPTIPAVKNEGGNDINNVTTHRPWPPEQQEGAKDNGSDN